ncbi:MAG: ABC transporter ATP-binding protein [Putridiphycobacter sp.]|nr:ABC transporter ATP-binding protein [Putridiphycobacter sp.]
MIEVKTISLNFGSHFTLQSGEFTIEKGLWALVGRNGSGKSTFLKALMGKTELKKGTIKLNQKEIKMWDSANLSKQLSVVYPKPNVFGNLSVKDVVLLGRIPYANAFGKIGKNDETIAEEALAILNLSHLGEKLFTQLSDGEKQMVMIARVIAQNTPYIILDEPTAFLDVVNRLKIIKMLKKIVQEHQKIIIFSTHDIEVIPKLCDGLIWIKDNQLNSSHTRSEFAAIIEGLFENEV